MDKNNHSTHTWVGNFAGRLMQLRPHLSIGAAVNYAVHSIHHASDLDPQRAAEIFVFANPMTESASPKPRAGRSEAPSATYRERFGRRSSHPS